jgi:acetyl esterase
VLWSAVAGLVAAPSAPAAQLPDITVMRQVAYVTGGTPDQVMDVYIPQGKGPFPGVIMIHGGGWSGGTTLDFRKESAYFAGKGFVAFAIDYRKAPVFHFPAQVEDAQSAVRYVREHADEFKVEPEHLGALGGSAGGQLAALLGVDGEGPRNVDDRVNVVVSWSGPMDFTQLPTATRETSPDGRVGRGPVRKYLGCSVLRCPETYVEASPVTHVDSTDAPMFLANGTQESVALQQPESMVAALRSNGVDTKLVEIPGQFHSVAYEDKTAPSLNGQTVMDASVEWMRQHIAAAQPSPTPSSPSPLPTGPPEDPVSNRFLLVAGIALVVLLAAGLVAGTLARRRRRSRLW